MIHKQRVKAAATNSETYESKEIVSTGYLCTKPQASCGIIQKK